MQLEQKVPFHKIQETKLYSYIHTPYLPLINDTKFFQNE